MIDLTRAADFEALLDKHRHVEEKLAEAEDVLRAIRSGEIDALVGSDGKRTQIFSVRGVDTIYRNLVDTMQEGAVIFDEQARIVYCNGQLAALAARPMEAILGSSLESLITIDDRGSVANLARRGQHERVSGGARLLANGTPIPVHLSCSPLADEDRRLVCVLVTDLREVETLRQYEQKTQLLLSQSEKSRRALLSLLEDEQHSRSALMQSAARLQRAMEQTIEAIAATVDKRDPYTAGHQARVSALAAAIARDMGLSDDQIVGIRLAGIVHDVGKINIPAELLSKPTRLTEIEYRIIQSHAEDGYEILKDVDLPWPIADIVWQHHERMDGSGYPRGLKENDILIEARIITVADVVEAMASHRPYRAVLGIEAALAEVERHRGRYYDEKVVDACLRLFEEKRFSFDAAAEPAQSGAAS